MTESLVLLDDPAEGVRRITLNRPEKRNALSNALRGELFEALHNADDDKGVRVTVLRGSGKCFSAGYELGGANEGVPLPFYHGGRRRAMAASCHRGLDEHLGSGEAGHRPGARLLPRRRERAGDGM